MKLNHLLSLLLVFILLLTTLTACSEEPSLYSGSIQPASVTSLEGAKTALAAGNYESAYEYLLTDQSTEAQDLLKKLVFVPTYMEFKSTEKDYWVAAEYTYDKTGNLLSVKSTGSGADAQSEKIIEYDQNGHITSITHSDKNQPPCHYAYNEKGWVISEQFNGDSYDYGLTYTYDNSGNVLSKTYFYSYGDSSTYTYTYDANGNMLTETDDYGRTTTYTYDINGRLLSETTSDSHIEYTYDEQGRLLSDGTYTYTYSESEGKTIVSQKRNGKVIHTADYTQDKAGNYLSWNIDKEKRTFQWKLCYYPNGVPHLVKPLLEGFYEEHIYDFK